MKDRFFFLRDFLTPFPPEWERFYTFFPLFFLLPFYGEEVKRGRGRLSEVEEEASKCYFSEK